MHRPKWAWPLFEKFLRGAAGLGKVPGEGRHVRYDVEHRRARVLVVGGGEAGRAAALRHAATAPVSCSSTSDPERRALELRGVEVIAPAVALGSWEGGLIPVVTGTLMLRYRAEHVVVATGAIDQPIPFVNNDLVGVMLPSAVETLVRALRDQAGRARGRARAERDVASPTSSQTSG